MLRPGPQEAAARGLVDPQLGSPGAAGRAPRTAVLNFVGFHADVAGSLAYHLGRLGHNVTVFVPEDREGLGLQQAMAPFYRKRLRRVGQCSHACAVPRRHTSKQHSLS